MLQRRRYQQDLLRQIQDALDADLPGGQIHHYLSIGG